MSDRPESARLEPDELLRLHGATVLVDARSESRNAVALRGTVEARSDERGEPSVKIVLEYPDMFTHPAHRGVIALDAGQARELLASDSGGVLHFTVDRIIDPGIEPNRPQAAS